MNTPARVTSPSSELPDCPVMLSHGLWHGMAMAISWDIGWREAQVFTFSLIAAFLGPRSACATGLFSEFGEVTNAKTHEATTDIKAPHNDTMKWQQERMRPVHRCFRVLLRSHRKWSVRDSNQTPCTVQITANGQCDAVVPQPHPIPSTHTQ